MKREQILEAILVIVAGLLVLSLLFGVRALVFVSLGLLCAAIFSRHLAEKIAQFWFGVAHLLGRINSFILLSAVFYLILTPVALISKLFNRSNLSSKKDLESFYIERDHEYLPEDFENTW